MLALEGFHQEKRLRQLSVEWNLSAVISSCRVGVGARPNRYHWKAARYVCVPRVRHESVRQPVPPILGQPKTKYGRLLVEGEEKTNIWREARHA